MADRAEGKHCSLRTPEGNPPAITHRLPPASPMGTGSSWRGRICPHPGSLLAGAACLGFCTSPGCPLARTSLS